MRAIFDTEALVECTDNGKTITADVDNFHQGVYLSVVMNTVKVNLQYESKFDQYVGSMGGLEFVSKGPKQLG
jgi:hypothetical protein